MNPVERQNTKTEFPPHTPHPVNREGHWSGHTLKEVSDSKPYVNQTGTGSGFDNSSGDKPIKYYSATSSPLETTSGFLNQKPEKKKKECINPDDVVPFCQAFTVNGKRIDPPGNGEEYIRYLNELTDQVKNTPDGVAVIQYGEDKTIKVDTTHVVGQGKHTVVYNVINESEEESKKVIKFTRPNLGAATSVSEDIKHSTFWMELENTRYFSVSKYIHCDPSLFFRVSEKIEGVTLTKILLNMGILKINFDQDNPGVIFYTDRINEPSVSEKMQTVMDAIMEMLGIMKENPEHYTSLSPNNIIISYSSSPNEKVAKITKTGLIDVGVNSSKKEGYEKIESFTDYLEQILNERCINKYVTNNNLKLDNESLKEWQNSSPFKHYLQ